MTKRNIGKKQEGSGPSSAPANELNGSFAAVATHGHHHACPSIIICTTTHGWHTETMATVTPPPHYAATRQLHPALCVDDNQCCDACTRCCAGSKQQRPSIKYPNGTST